MHFHSGPNNWGTRSRFPEVCVLRVCSMLHTQSAPHLASSATWWWEAHPCYLDEGTRLPRGLTLTPRVSGPRDRSDLELGTLVLCRLFPPVAWRLSVLSGCKQGTWVLGERVPRATEVSSHPQGLGVLLPLPFPALAGPREDWWRLLGIPGHGVCGISCHSLEGVGKEAG